ncbi:branched-chain amino acid ABC transporter permease [Anaerobium acetethylicum]|uniref:Branched-chain amino acid transport system permease protein n=1 Tax=Anaerobium acetethylicum TaxID=1619234 RepID=A0A1D3TYF2_9FIRM|nr:branched-chain amino acid ABC transporter permease [Anaerobium acetethylicum]SCP99456.1 branched-chain amino acid transport system permease protein [Anaerobium acetethylicum]
MKKYLSLKSMIKIGLLVVALIFPLFVSGNYVISILVNCLFFAAMAECWNIIGGYGGQVSWCHASFVAIGAYSNFILSNDFGITPFLSLPLGIGISFMLAAVIGHATFRLHGPYFSVATIACGEAVRVLIQYFDKITKGAAGIYVSYKGADFWALTFENDIPFYYLGIIVLLLTVLVTYLFTKSKTGYYLSAIKGDETAAESLGIEVFKVKLTAFQLSAMLSSVVGCFYASFLTYIAPTSTASFDLSMKIGVVAIVGGVASLWGPVVGGFIVILLIEATSVFFGAAGGSQMIYGLLLIVVIIFKPEGIIALFRKNNAEDSKNMELDKKEEA